MGGLYRVEPLVHERINVQPVYLGRTVHELPHPFGSCPRHRCRIERRFYHSHCLELERNVMFIENFLDYRHIVGAQAEYLSHLCVHLLGIQDDVVPDDIVVWKVYERIHRLYPLDIYRIRDIGLEPYGVHVVFFL